MRRSHRPKKLKVIDESNKARVKRKVIVQPACRDASNSLTAVPKSPVMKKPSFFTSRSAAHWDEVMQSADKFTSRSTRSSVSCPVESVENPVSKFIATSFISQGSTDNSTKAFMPPPTSYASAVNAVNAVSSAIVIADNEMPILQRYGFDINENSPNRSNRLWSPVSSPDALPVANIFSSDTSQTSAMNGQFRSKLVWSPGGTRRSVVVGNVENVGKLSVSRNDYDLSLCSTTTTQNTNNARKLSVSRNDYDLNLCSTTTTQNTNNARKRSKRVWSPGGTCSEVPLFTHMHDVNLRNVTVNDCESESPMEEISESKDEHPVAVHKTVKNVEQPYIRTLRSSKSEYRATKEATAGGNVTSDGTNVSHKSVDAYDKVRYISSVTKRTGSNFGKPPTSVSTSTRKHRRSSSNDTVNDCESESPTEEISESEDEHDVAVHKTVKKTVKKPEAVTPDDVNNMGTYLTKMLLRVGGRKMWDNGSAVDQVYNIEHLHFKRGVRSEGSVRGSKFLTKVVVKSNNSFTGYCFCIAEICVNRMVHWNSTVTGGSHQLKRHAHHDEVYPQDLAEKSVTGGQNYTITMTDIYSTFKRLVKLHPVILLDSMPLYTRQDIASVVGIVGGRLASDGRPLSVPSPATVCTRFKADNMGVKDKNKDLLANVINDGARVMLCVDMKSYGRFDRLHGTLVAVYYWDIQQKCSNTIILDMDLRLKPDAIDESNIDYQYVDTVLREYDITVENDIYGTICTTRNQPCAKVLNEVLANVYTTVDSSGGKCVQYQCVVASLLNKVDLSFASTISDMDVVDSDDCDSDDFDNWPSTVTKCAVVVNWIKETYPNDSCVQDLCSYDQQTMMSAMAMYKTLINCHSHIIEIISGCDEDDIGDKPEINWFYSDMNVKMLQLVVEFIRPVELVVAELSANIQMGDVENIVSKHIEHDDWGVISADWLSDRNKSGLFVSRMKGDIHSVSNMVNKIVVELDSVQNCPPVRPLKIEDVIDDISVTRLYEDMKAHQSIMHDILLIHCFTYSGAN